MAEIRQEETQQELFPSFSSESRKPERFPALQKTDKPILFSTSVEQLLLAAIGLILLCCLVFFLGVLRGKSLGSEEKPSRPAPAVQAAPLPAAPERSVPAAPRVKIPAATAQPVANTQISPKAAVETGDPSKPYSIQLVTYKKRDLAEREVAALQRAGLFATIIPSQEYYQVCVGQYSSRDEAKKDLKRFGSKYKGCFLRRR